MTTTSSEQAANPKSAKVVESQLSWQLRLLPVMAGVLVTLMVVALAASLHYYGTFVESMKPESINISEKIGPMLDKGSSPSQVQYRVAVMFEEAQLRGTHQTWYAFLALRTWTRFMVLMLAICVSMSGCAFILGKIDADFDGKGESAAFKAGFSTNSPGVVLVLAGVLLAWMACYYQVELGARPRSYLAGYGPAQAEDKVPDIQPRQPGEQNANPQSYLGGFSPPEAERKASEIAVRSGVNTSTVDSEDRAMQDIDKILGDSNRKGAQKATTGG